VWRPTGGQPYPGTRGAPTGGVSGAKRGRGSARFRSFPWCFQSHASVAVTGKNTLATVKQGPCPAGHQATSGGGSSPPRFSFAASQPLKLFTRGAPPHEPGKDGATARGFVRSWRGGGQELWDALSGQFNIKSLLCTSTGCQMGGWFTREVTSPEGYKGLRYRMGGLGAEVLRRLGAIAVTLPGGEIMPALKSGAIDASEWIGPWLDMALGLHKAVPRFTSRAAAS
jgi:Bacterial extracellular solute-binding protein, family 7